MLEAISLAKTKIRKVLQHVWMPVGSKLNHLLYIHDAVFDVGQFTETIKPCSLAECQVGKAIQHCQMSILGEVNCPL